MAIVFLGTSNCILGHSFVQTVKALTSENVINASLGSSPCTVGLNLLDGISLVEGDVVVLDYTITDEASLNSGLRTEAEIRKILASIFLKVSSCGAHSIMLINPARAAVLNVPDIEGIHIKICKELNVPIISASKLVRAALERGCPIDYLMIDAAHQSRAVCPTVGEMILEAAATVRSLRPAVRFCDEPVWITRRIKLADLVPPERRIERASSLIKSTMALLCTGDQLDLPVAQDEAILGFLINAGSWGANIRLVGRPEIVTCMQGQFDNRNPDAFTLVFFDLKSYVWGKKVRSYIWRVKEGVELNITNQNARLTEYTLASRDKDLDLYGQLHVDSILVGKELTVTQNASASLLQYHDLSEEKFQSYVEMVETAVKKEPHSLRVD